jgi:hypothetical protein
MRVSWHCDFGIIILHLLTGKQSQRVAETVEDGIEKENFHSIIDTKLAFCTS